MARQFSVYFDFRCEYSYQAALLLRRVRETGKRDFEVRWRAFSLAQVNNSQPGWYAWERPRDEVVPGRLAFLAVEAARRLGAYDAMHWQLLCARHEERRRLDDEATIRAAAENAGIQWDRLAEMLDDPPLLEALKRDHTEGEMEHSVFGTPTFVFPNGAVAYVRLRPAPEGGEAVRFFDELCRAISDQPYLRELKRPAG